MIPFGVRFFQGGLISAHCERHAADTPLTRARQLARHARAAEGLRHTPARCSDRVMLMATPPRVAAL